MNQPLRIRCPHCSAHYALPPAFKQHLEGKGIRCPGCQSWFVAVPCAEGPPVKMVDGKPARTPVDLSKYRVQAVASQGTAPGAAAAQGAAPGSAPRPAPASPPVPEKTTQIPVPQGSPRSLQVAVAGPDANLRNVFDLGTHAFLIGGSGCHLNLPNSALPDRAVSIRAADGGFAIEGTGGFALPIGPVSVTSCRLDPGQSLELQLEPYRVQLTPSQAVGSPIANLEQADPVPPAPAPAPAAADPAPNPPTPGAPPGANPWPGGDLRAQIQDFALDVHGDPVHLGGGDGELEMDQTLADLGSSAGLQARRFGNPLAGLDLRLVHTEGPTQGQLFKITKTPILIGRNEGDLVVQDRRVSGKHAQLDVAGPRAYTLKDLASTNGTSINDRPISIAPLEDGDVISFGGVKFEFVAKIQ